MQPAWQRNKYCTCDTEHSRFAGFAVSMLYIITWVVCMQAYAGPHSEASHLAAQVSQLSNELHAAQATAAAAQQEVNHLQSKQQVCTA